MLPGLGSRATQRATGAFSTQRRNFSADAGHHQVDFNKFLSERGSVKTFYPIVVPSFLAWFYWTSVNATEPIAYPDDYAILAKEVKDGLRNPDFSIKAKSLDNIE